MILIYMICMICMICINYIYLYYDLAHVAGVGAVRLAYSLKYFLNWTCTIQILHNLSQRQVRI